MIKEAIFGTLVVLMFCYLPACAGEDIVFKNPKGQLCGCLVEGTELMSLEACERLGDTWETIHVSKCGWEG